MIIIASCFLAGCTPVAVQDTNTPTNTSIPKATDTPVPSNPDEPTNTPQPTETHTVTPTPLPELIGHVEIGAGGPCDLYRWGSFEVAGSVNDVYFADPDGCKKLEQEGIQWINATFIGGEQIFYQNADVDLGLTVILDQFHALYPTVNLNQIELHAVYDEGRGVACKEEGSAVGDVVVCVSQSQDGRMIVHLVIVIEKVVIPDNDGGSGKNGSSGGEEDVCPPGQHYDPILDICTGTIDP